MTNWEVGRSVALAAATCVAEMLGGGVVSLPYSMVQTAIFPGGIMLIFGAVLTYYTGKCLSTIYVDMESKKKNNLLNIDDNAFEGEFDKPKLDNNEETIVISDTPYMEMSRIVFGKTGEYFMYFCVGITLMFVDIIFLILSGENVSGLLNTDSWFGSQTACILYFALGTLIVSYFWGQVSHYQNFVWVACLSTLIAILIAYPVTINYAPNPHPGTPNVKDVEWTDYFTTYGTIMFSFGGHAGFPSYQKNMGKHYKYFNYSLLIGYGYIFIMLFPFSISMAFLYGNSVEDNVLSNLPDNNVGATVIKILITTHMSSGMATLVPPVADILSSFARMCCSKENSQIMDTEQIIQKAQNKPENVLKQNKTHWWSPIIIQLICGALAVLLQDHFFNVMSILGNTTITICTFVMPCVLYVKYFKNKISIIENVVCWCCIIIGIATGIIAVTGAIIDIING